METMKQNKIIAVDTSLGTNFIVSASDDATVSELRGLIQMEHLSCFPELESIKVKALTVQFNQRQYHVTDSLYIGQIFRKRWNKIHAEVSSMAASISHESKSGEGECLGTRKAGNLCVALENTLLVKYAGSNGLGVDRHSKEALAHSLGLLLDENKVSNSCTGIIPAVSKSQDFGINNEKFERLFSMEAPYTQSHSYLNLPMAAAPSKEICDNRSDCRKRKRVEEESVGKKQNQAEAPVQIMYDSDKDKELSPYNRCPCIIGSELKIQEPKGLLLKGQQCNQDSQCRQGFSEEVAPAKEDAQPADGSNKLTGDRFQPENSLCANTCMADDSILEKQNKNSPNAETIMTSSGKLKLASAACEYVHKSTEECRGCEENLIARKSSLIEKETLTLEKEPISQTLEKMTIGRDLSSPKQSIEVRGEGAEEAILNTRVSIDKMDLSMGYPIQLNDHNTLLVASLSADVVPETQESQLESRDNVGDEEVVLSNRGFDVYDRSAVEPLASCLRQDPDDSQKLGAEGLPCQQVTRNMNSTELNNDMENIPLCSDKGTSHGNPSLGAYSTLKSSSQDKINAIVETGMVAAQIDEHERELHVCGPKADNHEVPLVRKKKKHRKRKVPEIHEVSVQENHKSVLLGSDGQSVKGDMDSKVDRKGTSQLMENQIRTCNHEKERESYHLLEKQAVMELGNFGDSGEIQKEGRSAVNVDEGNNREASCCSGEKSMALKVVCINSRIHCGEKCMEGSPKEICETVQEQLCTKQGEVKQSGRSHKKKKRSRKKPSLHGPEDALENYPLNMDSEGDVPFSIKELPNALRLTSTEEVELHQSQNAEVIGEQITKKKSKRRKKEMTETDSKIGRMQEQGQVNATVVPTNRNGIESLLEGGFVQSSSINSPSKELVKMKQGFDVFEFDSSETPCRPKEDCINNEVTSKSVANNLENLCSAAVKLVEDDILKCSKMTTRTSARKPVHPKRWITVLSERLTWSQMSKKNSKREHASKQNSPTKEDIGPPNDEEINPEAFHVEEAAAKEESSQLIVGDGRVACPAGCGKLYSKKTSAYYRHSKKCSGGDYDH